MALLLLTSANCFMIAINMVQTMELELICFTQALCLFALVQIGFLVILKYPHIKIGGEKLNYSTFSHKIFKRKVGKKHKILTGILVSHIYVKNILTYSICMLP